jgi:hypothetical protein
MNLILTAAFTLSSVGLAWFYGEARVIPLAAAWATLLWLLTVTAFQEAMLKRALRFPLVLRIQFIGLAAGVCRRYRCRVARRRVLGALRTGTRGRAGASPLGIPESEWRPRRSIAGTTATGPSLRRFWGSAGGIPPGCRGVGHQPDRLLVGRIGGAGTLGFYDAAMRCRGTGHGAFLSLTDIAVTSLARVRHSREHVPPDLRG